MTGAGALRHYGSPVDMMRQLAVLGVSARLTRGRRAFNVGWRGPAAKALDVAKTLEAFGAKTADEWWSAACVVAAAELGGVKVLEMPAGSSVEVDLGDAFARSSAELLPAGMLDRGLLQ